MLASELITELTDLINKHGDKQIFVTDYDQHMDTFVHNEASDVSYQNVVNDPNSELVFVID